MQMEAGSGAEVPSLLPDTAHRRVPFPASAGIHSLRLADVNLSCPLSVCFPPFLFLMPSIAVLIKTTART